MNDNNWDFPKDHFQWNCSPDPPYPPNPCPPPFCRCCCIGPAGPTGPTGPTGVNGLSEYAYIYNLDAQVVALEADILFSTNGVIVGAIAHTAGTSTILFGNAGDYAVWFYAAGVEPNQFSLFQNGAPVAGGIYGSGAGTQGNPGMVIITAAAGDVLTVRNHTSAADISRRDSDQFKRIDLNSESQRIKFENAGL